MCQTYILWHNNKLIRGQRRPVMAMRWFSISHHPIKSLSMSHKRIDCSADGYTQCTISIGSIADSFISAIASIN